MIRMTLSEAARYLHAAPPARDVQFSGCSIDSRSIQPEALFIALPGPHRDGHDFAADAARKQAAGALLEHPIPGAPPALVVDSTREAMHKLASAWRERFQLPMVAVTGSNGKTTVKGMLYCILSRGGEVLSTSGNLNNTLGVPLTLFRLHAGHKYGVVEMGAGEPGSLRVLAALCRPTVAVITQCATAHLEGFGSLDGVAAAKAEIYSALGKNGVAVINADDPYADYWRRVAYGRQQLNFSMVQSTPVHASDWHSDPESLHSIFTLHTPRGHGRLRLPLPGRHNVMNALAAAAAAHALGFDVADIIVGLEASATIPGRLQVCRSKRAGLTILDDSYNANPESLHAALQVLTAYPGRHWLLLGDMAELGEQSMALHAKSGDQARNLGVERLFTLGEMSRHAKRTFGDDGQHYTTAAALQKAVQSALRDVGQSPPLTILVKGSRSMHMETLIAPFLEEVAR